MHPLLRHPAAILSAAASVLFIVGTIVIPRVVESHELRTPADQAEMNARVVVTADVSMQQERGSRSAKALQDRITRSHRITLPISAIEKGLAEQRALLSRIITVSFMESTDAVAEWTIALQEHPEWLSADIGPGGLHYGVNRETVLAAMQTSLPESLRTLPQHSVLTEIQEHTKFTQAITDLPAKPGFELDWEAIAGSVVSAITNNQQQLHIAVERKMAPVVNQTGRDLGDLELLATGHSDFAGSGVGRKSNVRKGLSEHLHNVLVAPDGDFSFNAIIAEVPAHEWKLALGIFNGYELRPVAGGGICQVATTMYRAALLAGLPILKRANHSLYVTYYEKHGVGIDATVFPGKQDLTFHNDTGNYLLIQAYTEGDEAFVNIFGTPDGRAVALEGPYFANQAVPGLDRLVRGNEIAWSRRVALASGEERTDVISSRYKAIPRKLSQTYSATLHAAATDKNTLD